MFILSVNEKDPVILNVEEVKIGDTIFVVTEVQSENAKETVEEKMIRLIRRSLK